MSVAHVTPSTELTRPLQWPLVTRDVTDLPQTVFRTALRGFDRDEVRTVLEDIATDYRVLQMQNASLRRQLANLEATLASSRRDDNSALAPVRQHGDHVLQRANDQAQAILSRAHAQAEEMLARARARVQVIDRYFAQLEQDQGHFRTVLGSTISDLLTVLTMTRDTPQADNGASQELAAPRPVASLPPYRGDGAPVKRPAPPQPLDASAARKDGRGGNDTQPRINGRRQANAALALPSPSLPASTSASSPDPSPATTPRPASAPGAAAASPVVSAPKNGVRAMAAQLESSKKAAVEQIEMMLRKLDAALVGIPALPAE
jgi:DivIVA domain-containing protein